MTLSSLRQQVLEQLQRLGMTNLELHAGRVVEAANRAKNRVFDALLRLQVPSLGQRQTINITKADPSFDLPARTRHIMSIHDTGGDDPVPVKRVWAAAAFETCNRDATLPVLYREGAKMYFANRDGAPATTTFLIRFAATPAHAQPTGQGAAFTEIPDEFDDLLVYATTAEILPAGRGRLEMEARLAQRLADIGAIRQSQDIHDNADAFARDWNGS